MRKKTEIYVRGIKDGIPVFLGYVAVSFSFGILAAKEHLTILEAVAMSALNVTSAGQFAGLEIIAAQGTIIEMILSQTVINLRYALMSCALSQKLASGTGGAARALVAFGNTDEVFALSMAYEEPLPPVYAYGLITSAVPGWILGTFLGAAAGSILPQLILNALGILLYGMFIAIVIPPFKKDRALKFVVPFAAAVSMLFEYVPFLRDCIPAGLRVVVLTVTVSALAAAVFPRGEDEP